MASVGTRPQGTREFLPGRPEALVIAIMTPSPETRVGIELSLVVPDSLRERRPPTPEEEATHTSATWRDDRRTIRHPGSRRVLCSTHQSLDYSLDQSRQRWRQAVPRHVLPPRRSRRERARKRLTNRRPERKRGEKPPGCTGLDAVDGASGRSREETLPRSPQTSRFDHLSALPDWGMTDPEGSHTHTHY